MSWIKVRTNLSDDPSVWEIADALNMDAFAVIGRLHSMWAWFDGQATADDPWVYVTSTAMDRRLACAGWCAAVAAAGWLLIDGNRLGIPNFDRHNGQSAKDRALTQARQFKHRDRASQYAKVQTTGHGPVTLPSRSRNAGVTLMSRSSDAAVTVENTVDDTQSHKSLHSNTLSGHAPVTVVALRERDTIVTPPSQEEREEREKRRGEKTDADAPSTLKNTLSNTSGPALLTPDPELVSKMLSGAEKMRAAINRRNKGSPASEQIPLEGGQP